MNDRRVLDRSNSPIESQAISLVKNVQRTSGDLAAVLQAAVESYVATRRSLEWPEDEVDEKLHAILVAFDEEVPS